MFRGARTTRSVLAAAFLVTISGASARQAGAAAEISGARRTTLENGVVVVAVPRAGVPLAAAISVVRAGLSDETPDLNGVSHMLEHLLFNGTATRTQEQLYADLDNRGIVHNAQTGIDGTNLFMLGPRDALPAMLDMEADMLFRSSLPAEKLEKERGIVLNEIVRERTREAGRVDEAAAGILYAGTSCAMPILGTETTIRSMTREGIAAYHRARFTPANTTLVLMGDIDPAGALEAARATFGAVPARVDAGAPPAAPCIPASSTAGRVHTRRLDISSRHVVLLAAAPALGEPLHPAAALLAPILEVGLGEAAGRRLPAGSGRLLEASVSIASQRSGGVLEVRSELDPNLDYARAARALLQETAARLKAPVDPSVLQDRKVAERVRLALLEERPHFFAIDRTPLIACCGWQGVAESRARLASVTPLDLARVASAYADLASWSVLYAGPDADGASTTWPDAPEGSAATKEASLPAGAPIAPVEIRDLLANGLTLRLKCLPGSGVFGTQVTARERALNEPPGKAGIADLLHRLAGTATRSHDEAALDRALTRIGAALKVTDDPEIPYDDADTGPEFSFLRIETLDEFAEEALSLLAEMIREPTLDAAEVDRQRAVQSSRARQAAQRPSEVARGLLLSALLGPAHPLASPPFGTEDSLSTITPQDLAIFREAYFDPSNLILSVVTSLPPEEISPIVARTFGALEPAGRRAAAPPAPLKPLPPGSLRRPSGAQQAYILQGALLKPDPSEVPAVAAAAAVLSRRISFELREKRGLAYALGAGVEALGDRVLFTVRIGTKHDQVGDALAGIEEILSRMASSPPTAEEIARATRTEGVRILMRATSRANQAAAAGLEELRSGTPGALLWKDLTEPDARAVERAARKHLLARKLTAVVLE